MPAVSKAQKSFFSLVKAVQSGKVPPSKVTSNVRDAAADTSKKDVTDMLQTKDKKLPDRIIPKGDDSEKEKEPEKKEEGMNPMVTPTPSVADAQPRGEGLTFFEIVGRYNDYRKVLQREHTLGELAMQLGDIAEYAEYALTNETNDWFDAHTIRRNIKEMQTYAKEFSKVAEEADSHHMRLEALFDDMGRILERYFDIYDAQQNSQPQDASAEPNMIEIDNPEPEVDEITERAINVARSRLKEADIPMFDSLPKTRQALVSWRLISAPPGGGMMAEELD